MEAVGLVVVRQERVDRDRNARHVVAVMTQTEQAPHGLSEHLNRPIRGGWAAERI